LQKGKSVDDLLRGLWSDFKAHPDRGVSREDLYKMIENLGGPDVLLKFSTMIETTQDIDFDSALKSMGCEFKWTENNQASLGVDWEGGDRAVIKTVLLDSSAYKAGLNSGDEIIFVNGLRFMKEDASGLANNYLLDTPYEFIVSRLGKLERLEVIFEKAPKTLKEIIITDKLLAEKSFAFKAI
jgi:predicted metalloprotease with PDZ domain